MQYAGLGVARTVYAKATDSRFDAHGFTVGVCFHEVVATARTSCTQE
jgi:hypothetical protein